MTLSSISFVHKVNKDSQNAKVGVITCALKRDAQLLRCKGVFLAYIILPESRSAMIIDDRFARITLINCKLKFSPNCHNIFILTMPTALGRCSGAVYGEKSPIHTCLVFNVTVTLYILHKAIASESFTPRFEPRQSLHFFFFQIYLIFITLFILVFFLIP